MRMKKMLAVLAAISMLATMGISAAAEDEAVVTTTVTTEEAVTTTATEMTTETTETTAETTTGSETETTVTETTVATEENEIVKEVLEDGTIAYGTKTYQMGENGDGTPYFHEVKVVLYSEPNESDPIERLSVYVDGTLSNLAGIALGSAIAGDQAAHDYRDNPDNFFAITGVNEVAITAYGVTTSYYYVDGQFVKVGETPDTPTKPDTPDETVTEEMLYNKFVAAYGKPVSIDYGDFNGDGELDAYASIKEDFKILTYFVTADSITLTDANEEDPNYSYDHVIFTCNGYQFRLNLALMPHVYYASGNITIDRVEKDGNLTAVNFASQVLYDEYEGYNLPHLAYDKMDDISTYFSSSGNMITITHYSYTNAGSDVGSTNYVYDAAKNAFVEAGSSNDGKTDSGSTSKPSTNNTTGTPKTGDVATLPAVALGLTMTAAGVAAIIYKKRK